MSVGWCACKHPVRNTLINTSWPVAFRLFSKRDNELLLRLIANLNMLMRDDSVNVVKKAILTLTQLYKVALQVSSRYTVFIVKLG